jgi:hypothetical protein
MWRTLFRERSSGDWDSHVGVVEMALPGFGFKSRQIPHGGYGGVSQNVGFFWPLDAADSPRGFYEVHFNVIYYARKERIMDKSGIRPHVISETTERISLKFGICSLYQKL